MGLLERALRFHGGCRRTRRCGHNTPRWGRWEQFDLKAGPPIGSNVKKKGRTSTYPLRGPELHGLRQLRPDWPAVSVPVCLGARWTDDGEQRSQASQPNRSGRQAALSNPSAYAPARLWLQARQNEGHYTRSPQHYLGHKNIAHTVRYTDLALDRFKEFWRD
jgi:hypothetical protein